MQKLKTLWKRVEDNYIRSKKYFYLTPSHYSIYYNSYPFFKKYVKGRTLDLGAGRLAWKSLAERFASKYFACDIKLENKDLDFISEGEKLSLKDDSFDTVLCLQVIEHTKDPARILKEIARVLKKGNYAIVSFPHLSYIHSPPEDYFRYTIYGFKILSPQVVKIESFKESGGIISFISTPIFIFIHSISYPIFIIREIIFLIFKILSIIIFHIDKILGIKRLYPLNYIVVLKKC